MLFLNILFSYTACLIRPLIKGHLDKRGKMCASSRFDEQRIHKADRKMGAGISAKDLFSGKFLGWQSSAYFSASQSLPMIGIKNAYFVGTFF